MKTCNWTIVTAALSFVFSGGCSSLSTLGGSRTPHEAAIRDRLWSESLLIRGACPDDTTDTLTAGDKIDSAGMSDESVSPTFERTVEQSAAPAEPWCAPFSFEEDKCNFVPDFLHDVDSVCNGRNLCVLLAAGGVSYAIHQSIEDRVAQDVRQHPHRWGGNFDNIVGGIGYPPFHFVAVAGLYSYSLHTQDAEVHDLSKTLFNALAITGLSTIALKETIGRNTQAPNDRPDMFTGNWPSGHTSSSFAFAAVFDEYYGPSVGIPLYLLAGAVGWQRLDSGQHDVSDVVFGAVLGYVIGKTVAANHHARFCGMEFQPQIDPASGTTCLCLERRF